MQQRRDWGKKEKDGDLCAKVQVLKNRREKTVCGFWKLWFCRRDKFSFFSPAQQTWISAIPQIVKWRAVPESQPPVQSLQLQTWHENKFLTVENKRHFSKTAQNVSTKSTFWPVLRQISHFFETQYVVGSVVAPPPRLLFDARSLIAYLLGGGKNPLLLLPLQGP